MNITENMKRIEAEYLFGNSTLRQYMNAVEKMLDDKPLDVSGVSDSLYDVIDTPVSRRGARYHVYSIKPSAGFTDLAYDCEFDAMDEWQRLADAGEFTVYHDTVSGQFLIENDIRYSETTAFLKTDVKIRSWITEGKWNGIKFICEENRFDNSIVFRDETFGTAIRCNAA